MYSINKATSASSAYMSLNECSGHNSSRAMVPADLDCSARRADLNREMKRFTNVGSIWTMDTIKRLVIHGGPYTAPRWVHHTFRHQDLLKKRTVFNLQNPNDDMCFMWAALSAPHPVVTDDNVNRVFEYKIYVNTPDLSGLNLPMFVPPAITFERKKPTIMFNVYALPEDEQAIIPRHIIKRRQPDKHIDSLQLTTNEKSNYVSIYRVRFWV